MEIDNILKSFDLKIFKSRNVKSPTKAWSAAGFDFFIPEDLTITDFMTSYKAYLDEAVVSDRDKTYRIPLVFYIKSEDIIGEYKYELYLSWNANMNQFEFFVKDFRSGLLISFNDITDKTISLLNEKTSIISRIVIEPNAKINIPSGVHVNLPDNVFLKIDNKSGIASKRGLDVLACIIDTDYEGEIHLNMTNTSSLPVYVSAGEKIVQAIPMFQPYMHDVTEYKSLELLYKDKKSERGAGGFGSSGEK